MYSKIGLAGGFLSIVLAIAMLVSTAAAKDDDFENLLTNPDFETGTNGWSISAQWGGLSIDDKEESPAGEDYAVMLATINGAGPDAWNPELHSPPFFVDAGEMYTLDFWAKTEEGVVRPLGIKFEQLETWTGPSTTTEVTEEWQLFSYSPVMTVQSPPNVVIHMAYNGALEDVWYSHFRVYEGEFVEEELGGPKIAVSPKGRLATAWGQIKSK